jgi:hypothetical protein
MVRVTDQPYAFVNDNPLNVEDPLGLMITGMRPVTDKETTAIAYVNLSTEAAADAAKETSIAQTLTTVASTQNAIVQKAYQASQAALTNDEPDAFDLAKKYGEDVATAGAVLAPYARSLAQVAVNTYNLYMAAGQAARSAAEMNAAQIAADNAIGTVDEVSTALDLTNATTAVTLDDLGQVEATSDLLESILELIFAGS